MTRDNVLEWLNDNRKNIQLPSTAVFELIPKNRDRECPFCGDIGVVVKIEEPKFRQAFVMCSHCAARGTSCCSMPDRNGEYDETLDELADTAVAYWNMEIR